MPWGCLDAFPLMWFYKRLDCVLVFLYQRMLTTFDDMLHQAKTVRRYSSVNFTVSAYYYPNTKFVYGEGIPDFKAVKQSACKLQAILSSRR